MNFYKDQKGNVYAYESDGSQDAFIPKNLTPINPEEAAALSSPVISLPQAKVNALISIDQFHSDILQVRLSPERTS